MANVVHFGMLIDINKILKENNIEYSLHSIGGCVSCGLELRKDGEEFDYDSILKLINLYLDDKYMQVQPQFNNPNHLYVVSKFDLERNNTVDN